MKLPIQSNNIPPTSLYVHIPWCVRKCPYCDFNSHVSSETEEKSTRVPEKDYLRALKLDAQYEAKRLGHRRIHSIFIGGGTPSLFSASAIQDLMALLHTHFDIAEHAEITMEANPGTVEQARFNSYRQAGVNRISLGVQSFDDNLLASLGRIHNGNEARKAIETIKAAGFESWNLDLMHGLPGQSQAMAEQDLISALEYQPPHLSWYQLTIEQNTEFFSHPPKLPNDDTLADIQDLGEEILADHGLQQYEVSAYSLTGEQCKHNLNYWRFGDYVAIGAGAHGKLSHLISKTTDASKTATRATQIERYWKLRQPNSYLAALASKHTASSRQLNEADLGFEFMLNALRLNQGFHPELFSQRTGLSIQTVAAKINELHSKGLLETNNSQIKTSPLGRRFLNDVLQTFLPS